MKKAIYSPAVRLRQHHNRMKYDGTKISRKNLLTLTRRSIDENHEAMDLANLEQDVLRMKSFAARRGWPFPPATTSKEWMADKINRYYGKEVTKLVPRKNNKHAV